jgi:hypothetical protein
VGRICNRGRPNDSHGPVQSATGTAHLLFDDAVNDSTFSAAEATLRLNQRYKRNVVLSFKARSLGNEPHAPPFDKHHEAGLRWRRGQH